jgi:hypothetical protein
MTSDSHIVTHNRSPRSMLSTPPQHNGGQGRRVNAGIPGLTPTYRRGL